VIQQPLREFLEEAGWRERFAFIGVVLLATSAFLSTAGASLGLALVSLAFVADFDRWRVLLSSPVTLATAAVGAFVILHTLGMVIARTDWSSSLGEGAADWLKLLWFIPFGFCLGGSVRRTLMALGLALAGLLLGMFWRLDWTSLLADPARFFSTRAGFGFPAVAFALYSGTALIGLITLGGRLVGSRGVSRYRPPSVRFLGWLLALAVLLQGFIQSQTLAAWLAMAVVLPVILIAQYRQWRTPGMGWSLRRRVAIGGACVLVALLLAANSALLSHRAGIDADRTREPPSGAVTDAARSSFDQRWHLLLFGLEQWRERPWLGWGADVTDELIASGDRPQLRLESGQLLRHLHNTYLEVLVQFGVLGFTLFALPMLALLEGLRRASKERRIPADLSLFFGGALLFTLLWCLIDYRVVHHDWRVYWVLLIGSAYNLVLKWPLSDTPMPRGGSGSR